MTRADPTACADCGLPAEDHIADVPEGTETVNGMTGTVIRYCAYKPPRPKPDPVARALRRLEKAAKAYAGAHRNEVAYGREVEDCCSTCDLVIAAVDYAEAVRAAKAERKGKR